MFLDPHNISPAAVENAKRQPYNFPIPRLCFHPTELFPDKGDIIDVNKGDPEETDSPNPTSLNKKNSLGAQPQFRVVVGSRLWDFMTVIQYVGFNDMIVSEPVNTGVKNQNQHFSSNSRHVLMTGAPGSGKSTLLMTAAAFMTYKTMTNIYRVAGIGDARSWASSGDPFMYFALEMLVALRDYTHKQRHFDCDSGEECYSHDTFNDADPSLQQQPFDQQDDHNNQDDDTTTISDEESWVEEAGFLIEPRALASLSDVRSWMYAIRDRLSQVALSTINYDMEGGNNGQQQQCLKKDLRLKLIIMIDQAEYLLQHPDCIPAQILQILLELNNSDANATCPGASFLPSVILSVSSICPSLEDQFPPSSLLDLIRKQMIPSGQCLTYHVPSRLDPGMSERVSRLAIRRSITLSNSLRRHPLRQWERDLIASGEVRQWTGSVAGELVRFYRQTLNTSSSSPTLNSNRILYLLDSYIRTVHESVFASVSSYLAALPTEDLRSEKRRLLAVILRMALHMPLSSDDLGLAIPLRHLFLPITTRCHLALAEKSSSQSSQLQSLPTVQYLFHPKEGTIRMERIPTAVSMAIHTALLQPRLMTLLETKVNPVMDDSSSVLSRYLDTLVQTSFQDACCESRRRLITFYTRTRLTTQSPGCTTFSTLTGKSQLDDPVQVSLSGFVQYFSGMVACPAIILRHIINVENNGNVILVPTRFDYPYFEFFILDVKAKQVYVVCTAKEIWTWIKSPDTIADSSNTVLPSVTTQSTTSALDPNIVTSDMSNHGGVLSPQALLEAWQDSIQELFTYSDNQGASLDATIKVYDDFFSDTTHQSSKSLGSSTSVTARKRFQFPPSTPSTKKRKPIVSVKLVFVEDCRALAKCFGLTLP